MGTRICRIIGHDLVHFSSMSHWNSRRWRWEQRTRTRCRRCGIGEPDVWEQAWIQRVAWNVRQWWWGLLAKCEAMDRPDPPANAADDDLPF